MEPFDTAGFRQALGRFATGVTIVTAAADGAVHGMTANAFTAVSLSPPLVLISVDNRARMRSLLASTGRYGISILQADQHALSSHFAGRPIEGIEVEFEWHDGMPVIAGAIAHLVCSIRDRIEAGDHTLHIGHVDAFHRRDGVPLVFFGSRYETLGRQASQ